MDLIIWFGLGLIAAGVLNHDMRTRFKSLHIRGYYPFVNGKDQATYEFDKIGLIFFVLTALMGAAGFFAMIVAKLLSRSRLGWSMKFSPWTMEEALKEFPDDEDIKRRVRYIELYEKATQKSVAKSDEGQVQKADVPNR